MRGRHVVCGPDRARRFTQRPAHEFGPPSLAELSDFLSPHLVSAGNAGGSGEHNRPHVESPNGMSDERRDHIRLNPGVDRIAVVAEVVRSVDDYRLSEEHVIVAHRHDDVGDVCSNEVSRLAENPIVGLGRVIGDDLFRRQRLPADVSSAATPGDPGRSPLATRDPGPSPIIVIDPSAIMEDHPTPHLLGCIGHPVPAPIIGVSPTAHGVRPPTAGHVRNPDVAPARVMVPTAVGRERVLKLGPHRHLGVRGRNRGGNKRRRSKKYCRKQRRAQARALAAADRSTSIHGSVLSLAGSSENDSPSLRRIFVVPNLCRLRKTRERFLSS
jgi:hypothetical protein